MTTTESEPIPSRTRYERPAHPRSRGRSRVLLAGVSRRRDDLLGLNAPTIGERATGPAYVFAVLAALFYPLHQLLTRGELLLSGSMWAEMGTNYYATTQDPSLLQRLFATDAGYIPLPQRLIAFAGGTLGLPAETVPYLYTGSALVLAAVLIATVCLPVFRPVLASDGMRFVLAITLMIVPDYETRTFINFTYFAVVPAVALTALAAVQRDREVPAWAWVLPLFMLSKPGVLAVLPAMVLVAVVSRPRFRWITVVSVVAGLVQAVQLALSTSSGASLLQASDQSGLSKLVTALKYTLGFVGRLVLGPGTTLSTYPWMFAGLAVVVLSVGAALYLRSRATPLVFIGLSLVLFTMLVNGFTFSAAFTRDMALLSYPAFDRRFVVAVIGALFVVAGLVAMVVESPRTVALAQRIPRLHPARVSSMVGTAVLAIWLFLAGWTDYAAMINRPFGVPVGNVSQWQQMSPVLSSAEPVVCVPLDPFSWVYGRNCEVLTERVIPFYYAWTASDRADDGSGLELPVPREVRDAELASVGVMVRPTAGTSIVSGRAVVTDGAGRETVLSGEAELPADGGLLQFVASPTPLVDGARSLRLEFDEPVEVAALDGHDTDTTIVLWMGQPGSGE
ncbi:hypothetical protein [Blastococcus sp. CT_GayMR16]|uniref:hypothetical protein n=1 Tax=Blastococcus sp. CT_GayMR16 TaxID=2559607 RepID=UPI0010741B12|nr:hypothetical protein [Blastococcus sp. CT_GayMR16]TFV87789.1 hypothetical protein E4P38_12510 [Blastococcus sp. CT_GayMR16]